MGSRKKRKQPQSAPLSAKPAPAARKPAWLWPVVIAAVLGVVAVLFLRERDAPPGGSSPDAGGTSAASVALEDQAAVFARYAGSASCRECHPWEHRTWAQSHHGLAERPLTNTLDHAAFHPPRTFTHGQQTSTARLTNGQHEVVTLGFGGEKQAYPAERVIGHDPLRQFLVKGGDGRLQALETAWDPHRNEWFNVYGDENRVPGEWGHWTGRGMNWNNMCAACHNTRLRKNYDAATDSYRTAMAEMSVSCESCHGPMKAHVDWQWQHAGTGRVDPTVTKLTGDQMLDTCASCHSRRMELSGDFKPGDRFFDHYVLSIPDESNLFYPDGQVWDEDYEFTSFLSSKMHHAGVRCWDCHEPHSAKIVLPKENNQLCMRCHDGSHPTSPKIDPVAHSFHRPESTGNQCVNCHMPLTTYMQRHPRRDHGFTIPDPLLTKQHGIPNACNRCHTDKDTDWALAATEKWWGDRMHRPSRARTQALASAKAGDEAAKAKLLAYLRGEEPPFWKAVSANLLERWAHEPVVSAALIEASQHTNALVRANAAHSLGPLAGQGNTTVAEALRESLNDASRSVRYTAAWALRGSLDMDSLAGRELAYTLDYNQDQPIGQLQKGVFHLSRNDMDSALAHFHRAVEWDPRSADIRQELATVLSMAGRPQEALRHIEEACRLAPGNAEHWYRLGLAYNEAGRSQEVGGALERAVQVDPRHARAWYNLGLVRNQRGDVEGALSALARAESADATSPDHPYAAATILAQAGRTAEARTAAARALSIEPRHGPAQQLLQQLPRP
jgi:predicted CXXCH cytochrome family protein